MKCKKIQKLFNDYLENSLTDIKKIAIEQHTLHCLNCREKLTDLKSIILSLNSLKEYPLPYYYNQRLHQKLLNESQQQSITSNIAFVRNILRPAAVGLLAIIIIFSGYKLLFRDDTREVVLSPAKNTLIKNQEGIFQITIKSAKEVKNITLEITLPESIWLTSDSVSTWSEQKIYWQGDLQEGENIICVFVRGTRKGDFNIKTRLMKESMEKRLDVPVTIL